MPDICGDNRFKIIASAKQKLIEATNIESRPDEMAVIDSILFRMWQMHWLPGCERAESTCEGCIENDKTDNGDWCEMCSRCHPDLYRTKSASDTSDQARTCRIIEDPYRPIFKCCSSCYMHMEGNESECPSCKAKVVE